MGRILIATHVGGLLDELTTMIGAMGHMPLAARHGDEAWRIVDAHRPDIVLADAALPGRSGPELLAAIRRDPGLASIAVILIGVEARTAVPEPCRFVDAPIDRLQLRRAIVDALGAARTGLPAHPADVASARRRDLLLRWLVREIDDRLTAARQSAAVVSGPQPGVTTSDHPHLLLAQLSRLDVLVDSLAAVVEYARPGADSARPTAGNRVGQARSAAEQPRRRALA